MIFKGVDIVCPHCRGELDRARDAELACVGCSRRFPIVLDVPDLRIFPDPYIDPQEERAKAQRLAERFADLDFAGLVEFYYSITPKVPPHHAKQYARSLLAAGARAPAWLAAWEAAAEAAHGGSLLDVGCGTGPLLVAAKNYPRRAGVDIALRWLVVAKKRLAEAGLDIPLVCACAEALPFRDATFDRVAADSTLEHLRDQQRSLAEVFRVMHAGAHLFLSTPNRFSIGPDPHTGIWAGSLLPNSWTQAIVRRQGGVPPQRQLLSGVGLKKMLRDAGFADIRLFLPSIPAEQRAHFPPAARALIAMYDVASRVPVSKQLLFAIGPQLQGVARKPVTQEKR